jgi:hypothetical protein
MRRGFGRQLAAPFEMDKLWEHNTLLNATTMARFRISVERLGYEIGEISKHGNFEAVGYEIARGFQFAAC